MQEKDIMEKLRVTRDRILERKIKTGEFFYCHCCGKGPLVFVNLDYKGNVSCDECVGSLKGSIYLRKTK